LFGGGHDWRVRQLGSRPPPPFFGKCGF
jgi:hypothetical protein